MAKRRGGAQPILLACAEFLHAHPVPILVVSGVIAPAAGTFLVTYGQDRQGRGDWVALLGGIAVILLGGLLLTLKEVATKAITGLDLKVAEQFRITLKDAVQPLAELVAEMPAESRRNRERAIDNVAREAVAALKLLLKDVYRLRATVFRVTPSGDMECIAYHGRGDGERPQAFRQGTERGDRALAFVRTAKKPLFVHDLDDPKVAGLDYAGSETGYKTFISASIHTEDLTWGMVTIDAPRAGALVSLDQYMVGLMADLLAIAFAMGEQYWVDNCLKMYRRLLPDGVCGDTEKQSLVPGHSPPGAMGSTSDQASDTPSAQMHNGAKALHNNISHTGNMSNTGQA